MKGSNTTGPAAAVLLDPGAFDTAMIPTTRTAAAMPPLTARAQLRPRSGGRPAHICPRKPRVRRRAAGVWAGRCHALNEGGMHGAQRAGSCRHT